MSAARASGSRWGVRSPIRYGVQSTPSIREHACGLLDKAVVGIARGASAEPKVSRNQRNERPAAWVTPMTCQRSGNGVAEGMEAAARDRGRACPSRRRRLRRCRWWRSRLPPGRCPCRSLPLPDRLRRRRPECRREVRSPRSRRSEMLPTTSRRFEDVGQAAAIELPSRSSISVDQRRCTHQAAACRRLRHVDGAFAGELQANVVLGQQQ